MPTYTKIFSDDFQRANEEPLDPANWTVVQDELRVVSDACLADATTNYGQEAYTGLPVPDDQYAECIVGEWNNADSLLGIALRGSVSNPNLGYFLYVSTNGTGNPDVLDVYNSNFAEKLYTQNISPQTGDVLRLEVQGTTITAYYNGVVVYSGTDSLASSGVPELFIEEPNVSVTYFETGSISSGEAYDPTQPFLGSVQEVASDPDDTGIFVGTFRVLASAPAGLPNPYLGKIKVVSAPPGNANPSLGQVVVITENPTNNPDVFLGEAGTS